MRTPIPIRPSGPPGLPEPFDPRRLSRGRTPARSSSGRSGWSSTAATGGCSRSTATGCRSPTACRSSASSTPRSSRSRWCSSAKLPVAGPALAALPPPIHWVAIPVGLSMVMLHWRPDGLKPHAALWAWLEAALTARDLSCWQPAERDADALELGEIACAPDGREGALPARPRERPAPRCCCATRRAAGSAAGGCTSSRHPTSRCTSARRSPCAPASSSSSRRPSDEPARRARPAPADHVHVRQPRVGAVQRRGVGGLRDSRCTPTRAGRAAARST